MGKGRSAKLGSQRVGAPREAVKPESSPLTIREAVLRKAQRNPDVQKLLIDAMAQERHLEQHGLIKSD